MLIQGYSEVSVSRAEIRNDLVCDLKWGACFKLDGDVRVLFPYINAAVEGARYQYRPHHVAFHRKSVLCTLHPEDAMAAPFRGRDHALEFIEDLVVFLNDLYARRHELTPSHKLYCRPPSIVDILKTLPRTNCRECGYATCLAFAAALRTGQTRPGNCPGFAEPISVNSVYPVLGPDGSLAATFSIENENHSSEPAAAQSPETTSIQTHSRNADAPKTPLRDRFGLRIQYDLTPREIQVLRLVAEGASNPEISQALHISPHTVKSHVIHIFNKLNVNDRTQAAVWATRNRVI